MELEEPLETQLRELVARLDSLVPRDGAYLTLTADSSGRTSIGNRLGYLRLGVEWLVAALAPLPESDEAPTRIAPNLRYLLTAGSSLPFDLSEVDEAIGSRPPVEARLGLVGHLVAGVALVALLLLSVFTVFALVRWVFS